MRSVVVVGGGISGLSAAYSLRRQAAAEGVDIEVTVLESAGRPGGKIHSVWEDGFLWEAGPNGFLSSRTNMVDLSKSLSLDAELLPSNDAAAKRYILTKGELEMLPMSPPAFLKTSILSLRGKLRILKEPWTKPAPEGIDETVAEFAERHLGREAVDQLIGPFVTGVFAGDPDQMSVASCLPVMKELEKEGSGSLIRAQIRRMIAKKKAAKASAAAAKSEHALAATAAAPVEGDPADGGKRAPRSEGLVGATGKLMSFGGGMQVMTDALAGALGSAVRTGQRVTSITRSTDNIRPWRIWTEGEGEPYQADVVILAAPSYAASSILAELDEDLSRLLEGIPYSAVNVMCLGYDRDKIEHSVDGFGFLIPFSEGRKILGSVWTSSVFPQHAPEGSVSLRAMIGGARGGRFAELDDDDTYQLALDELLTTMGIRSVPRIAHLFRHQRAIPQYVVGHGARLDNISERLDAHHPGLLLTGNAYRGVSMPDCVKNSTLIAAEALEFCRPR